MDLQNNEFSKIESLKSNKITFIAKAIGAFVVASTISGIIILEITIIESEKPSAGLKIFSIVLSLILLSSLVYFVLKDVLVTRENKITKVVVDQYGLHHYKDELIIESLTYESLCSNPDLKNDDVILSEGEDVISSICVYYFDTSRKTIMYKSIELNTSFSISNAKELKRHFIKGVLKFRSDLKISPKVLAVVNIKNSYN